MLRDGRRAGADGARGAGADDLDRVRGRRGPARPAAVPGAGTARDRGPGPRRRGLRRQDRHADRERHAGRSEVRRQLAGTRRRDDRSHDALAALAADDARPNASMQAIAEAYTTPPGWTATATAPFKSATKWSGIVLRRARQLGDRRTRRAARPGVRRRPNRPSRSARRACGCCCWVPATVPVDDPDAPGTVTPAALVVLEQRVRPDARETLDYFAAQKVSVKVISGRQRGVGGRGGRARSGWRGDADGRPQAARRDPTQLADALEDAHRRSAGCAPTRSGPWCTPCSRAGTRSR